MWQKIELCLTHQLWRRVLLHQEICHPLALSVLSLRSKWGDGNGQREQRVKGRTDGREGWTAGQWGGEMEEERSGTELHEEQRHRCDSWGREQAGAVPLPWHGCDTSPKGLWLQK